MSVKSNENFTFALSLVKVKFSTTVTKTKSPVPLSGENVTQGRSAVTVHAQFARTYKNNFFPPDDASTSISFKPFPYELRET